MAEYAASQGENTAVVDFARNMAHLQKIEIVEYRKPYNDSACDARRSASSGVAGVRFWVQVREQEL